MSKKFLNIYILIIVFSFYSIKSQINVLAPPSVVQKVKELDDGSKKIFL